MASCIRDCNCRDALIKRLLGTTAGVSGMGVSSYWLYRIITDPDFSPEEKPIVFKAVIAGMGGSASLTINSMLPPKISKKLRSAAGNWSLPAFLALTLAELNVAPFFPQTLNFFNGAYYAFFAERLVSDLLSISSKDLKKDAKNLQQLEPLMAENEGAERISSEEKFLTPTRFTSIFFNTLAGGGAITVAQIFPTLEPLNALGVFLIFSQDVGMPLEYAHHRLLKKHEIAQISAQANIENPFRERSVSCSYKLVQVIPKVMNAFNGLIVSGSFALFILEGQKPILRALWLIPASTAYGIMRSSTGRKAQASLRPSSSSRSPLKCFSKAYLSRSKWKKRDIIAQVAKLTLSGSAVTLFFLGLTQIPEMHNDERNSIAWGTFAFGLPVTYLMDKELDARHTEVCSWHTKMLHFECVQYPLLFTYFFLMVTSFMKIGDETLDDYEMGQYIFALFTWFIYANIYSSMRVNREGADPYGLGLTDIVAQVFLAQQLLQ